MRVISSIRNRLRLTFSRLLEAWKERAQMAKAPNYDEARLALGGVPWREWTDNTDSWFIDDGKPAPRAKKRRK
jgi:hypothetical protein